MTGKRNWSYDVNSIIQHLRLPENVFENFVACDILNVKHQTFLLMEEGWKRDISNKPKLRKSVSVQFAHLAKSKTNIIHCLNVMSFPI